MITPCLQRGGPGQARRFAIHRMSPGWTSAYCPKAVSHLAISPAMFVAHTSLLASMVPRLGETEMETEMGSVCESRPRET